MSRGAAKKLPIGELLSRKRSPIGGGLQSETRVVAGMEMTVQQMPVMEALGILPQVLAGGVATLKGADLRSFTVDMLRGSFVVKDGEKIDLVSESEVNRAFESNLIGVMAAIAFAQEVNFRGFFAALPKGQRQGGKRARGGSEPKSG